MNERREDHVNEEHLALAPPRSILGSPIVAWCRRLFETRAALLVICVAPPLAALIWNLRIAPSSEGSRSIAAAAGAMFLLMAFGFPYLTVAGLVVSAHIDCATNAGRRWRRIGVPIAVTLAATAALLSTPPTWWWRPYVVTTTALAIVGTSETTLQLSEGTILHPSTYVMRADERSDTGEAILWIAGRRLECANGVEHHPRVEQLDRVTTTHAFGDWFHVIVHDL